MAILPKKIRFWLFDTLSEKTMRYVQSVPRHTATDLVAEVYDQIADDFFINGSLTSRSTVPELLAAIWTGGRETILVSDELDRTTKEAMAATLSAINDCPYCGDMLVSLVHADDRADDANQIFEQKEQDITDRLLRDRLVWVKAILTPGNTPPTSLPFTQQQLPEAIGSLMAMSDINRFSHIVMDGSPVQAPFGMQRIKRLALRLFGNELRATHVRPLEPGRTLHLLPKAELPEDMEWANSNPRIAQALAQWTAAVENQAKGLVPSIVQQFVHSNLSSWRGELMPMGRGWVEQELGDLKGENRSIAKFALLLAKAAYQIDDKMVEELLGEEREEERFIRILAWSSFTASRYVAKRIADLVLKHQNKLERAA